jgi:hypothetical protein
MPKYSPRVFLSWLLLLLLTALLAPTAFANSSRPQQTHPARQVAVTDAPGIDPGYIYQQLDTMVTQFQQREAGYDNNLPASVNGHDEFANYWAQEMLRLLGSYGATLHRDSFPIAGWTGRPPTRQAFNVEVTVPGALHPEQVVVIGCHYDGMAFSGQSANDDASGCAIELGVAKAMSEFWTRHHLYPARTLRFVIFDAEEQGLFGSFHYVNNTVNGDLKNIVAMFNEEQNGIAYPLRYLGKMANALMPYYIDMSPLQNNSLYPRQDKLSAQQRTNIVLFRQLIQQAVVSSFQQFRAMGDQMLTYHSGSQQDSWQPIFTPDHLSYIHQGDDTIGSSDQMPFTLAGLPCATLVGNSTYYNPDAPAGSYPYDQPQDTLQLMNIFADGNTQQSQALTLALALPGMITTTMLSSPTILGSVSATAPIAAISSIGISEPGQAMSFDGAASYDPLHKDSALSYAWTFGDGGNATGQRVSHTYAHSGNYTLHLTVSSAAGGTQTISRQLSIGVPTTYNNPYGGYSSDGMPQSNPRVVLPTADASLSDQIGTVAKAAQVGTIASNTGNTAIPPGLSLQSPGGIILLSVLIGVALLVIAGLLVARRRRRRA